MNKEVNIELLKQLSVHAGWQVVRECILSDMEALEREILEEDQEPEVRRGLQLKRLDLKFFLETPERLILKMQIMDKEAPNADPYFTPEDMRKMREEAK